MTRDPAITLLVMTDGRVAYLDAAIQSLEQHVVGPWVTTKVIWDDSANDDVFTYLRAMYGRAGYRVQRSALGRAGFAGAIAQAWRMVAAGPTQDFVFHAEDDFTYNGPVDLGDMVTILRARSELAQLALKRQPWGPDEEAAGGFMEAHPELYADMKLAKSNLTWCEHRAFFTSNPSLIPWRVIVEGWPDVPGSEQAQLAAVLTRGMRCGYLGRKADAPRVTHIGLERAGHGY